MSDDKGMDDATKMKMTAGALAALAKDNKIFFRVKGQDGELYYGQFNSSQAETFLGDTEDGDILFIGVHELIGPAKHGDEFDDNIIPFPKK